MNSPNLRDSRVGRIIIEHYLANRVENCIQYVALTRWNLKYDGVRLSKPIKVITKRG